MKFYFMNEYLLNWKPTKITNQTKLNNKFFISYNMKLCVGGVVEGENNKEGWSLLKSHVRGLKERRTVELLKCFCFDELEKKNILISDWDFNFNLSSTKQQKSNTSIKLTINDLLLHLRDFWYDYSRFFWLKLMMLWTFHTQFGISSHIKSYY